MSERVWLHRISHCKEVSFKLLEMGYLTIGFSDIAKEEFLNEILNNDIYESRIKFFEEEFEKIWGPKKRNRYSLWRFIHEFKDNDIVVVPYSKEFDIYKLIGKPMMLKDVDDGNIVGEFSNADLGFVWKVEPLIRNAKRSELFSRKLISRMKIRDTNANITDLKDEIENAIDIVKNNKLFDIHDFIIDSMIKNIEEVINEGLSDHKFEKLVKWYMDKCGSTDTYIPSKNESGKENGADADVVAIFKNLKVVIYIQVKYHRGFTEGLAVEQINEYKNQREYVEDEYTYIPWVISSADEYSDNAKSLANEYGVRLIGLKEFCKMIIDIGIQDINEAFR
ncbi:restriction endonuclease [Clostridium saudiense]|uniref:restriction endonuclease n=1 Tax=Clostridium saudiense TaxID=1414720 RepID=UPI0004B0EB7B|nr:restriction endonuclease [Clostridium saudiense]